VVFSEWRTTSPAIFRQRQPQLPQVACFDTAFHRGHPEIADRYALPEQFYQEGVRRYGFHGLSYEYIASRLPELAPDIAKGRVVVAHLGSGASMCAMQAGKSLESTMGFTALDGLPMGTRIDLDRQRPPNLVRHGSCLSVVGFLSDRFPSRDLSGSRLNVRFQPSSDVNPESN
jgi:acetate kinase